MEPREGRPITYILPTTAWASLLDVIVREAPAGAVIATYTEAMFALSEQALAHVGAPMSWSTYGHLLNLRRSTSMLPNAPHPLDLACFVVSYVSLQPHLLTSASTAKLR